MTATGINVDAIEIYLKEVIRLKGTDLLITPGSPARVRVDGKLVPVKAAPALHAPDCARMIESLLNPEQLERLHDELDLDLSFSYEHTHRFRANCFYRSGELAMSIRAIPLAVPSPEEIGIPQMLAAACDFKQGFVLVTGPTGSGKSTTLASMIEYINERRPVHILTIEDPIEYTHQHRVAAIDQREVGVDTHSFARALRSALREDPDVILVGEMRDPETIQFALTLAETGHLVFATLHTNDASSRSTASPTCSRPSARPRSGSSSRRRSSRSSPSGCSRARGAASSLRSSCSSRTTRCATSFVRVAPISCAT